MTKQILIGIAGFLAFSITGIAAASAIAHPDVPLTTQAQTAVEHVTGLDLGSRTSNVEEEKEVTSSKTKSAETVTSSDDRGENESRDERGEGDDEGDDDGGSRGTTTTTTPPPTTTTTTTFTLADIAQHNTVSSCYTAINGSVYDVTSWISQHPGGSAAIKSLCGIDGSAAFDGQHGGQSRPASELAGFKIGTLGK